MKLNYIVSDGKFGKHIIGCLRVLFVIGTGLAWPRGNGEGGVQN